MGNSILKLHKLFLLFYKGNGINIPDLGKTILISVSTSLVATRHTKRKSDSNLEVGGIKLN
jgi:hypothetical protein